MPARFLPVVSSLLAAIVDWIVLLLHLPFVAQAALAVVLAVVLARRS